MWNHVWKMLSQGFAFAMLWPLIPQFVCNCLFYWALYLSPLINMDLVVRHLVHPETQALWRAARSQPGFVTPFSPQQLKKGICHRWMFDWLVCCFLTSPDICWMVTVWIQTCVECSPRPQRSWELQRWCSDAGLMFLVGCRTEIVRLTSEGRTK